MFGVWDTTPKSQTTNQKWPVLWVMFYWTVSSAAKVWHGLGSTVYGMSWARMKTLLLSGRTSLFTCNSSELLCAKQVIVKHRLSPPCQYLDPTSAARNIEGLNARVHGKAKPFSKTRWLSSCTPSLHMTSWEKRKTPSDKFCSWHNTPTIDLLDLVANHRVMMGNPQIKFECLLKDN